MKKRFGSKKTRRLAMTLFPDIFFTHGLFMFGDHGESMSIMSIVP